MGYVLTWTAVCWLRQCSAREWGAHCRMVEIAGEQDVVQHEQDVRTAPAESPDDIPNINVNDVVGDSAVREESEIGPYIEIMS